ncbi:PTS sugar transporter subunit IIB [Buttiauxella sp. S04-F03]|uniref:PTS system mannose/fructose/N-acetylgalactosamine-transporter subunit IIB n=1 Tax=Buttiauxella sp. W03-F01 TaxID=2904524 RepID=UPI001E64EC9B|nr:PTS sugar transporter subunit IIB [Buttiauxella sp. W03-F01]MCE0799467.1 PTS sugar transporter subunit IIB [Buttiauxella sp. W03-F01]
MIKMIRIDDRLIHGQVALVWSRELNIDRLIVANDTISKNDMQKTVLEMAAPESVKTLIIDVDTAIRLVNDPRSERLKIFIVVNTPQDMRRLAQGINGQLNLNVANYGRISDNLSTKTKVADTVYLTPDDFDEFKTIFEIGHEITYQPLPSDSARALKNMLEGK